MSSYTTELRYILESGVELPLKYYPIWDESYRTTLNNRIIQHFYFREIGVEPYGKFAYFLERKMNEIMPFYNNIYNSQLDFYNTHYLKIDDTNTYNGTSSGDTTDTRNKSNTSQINSNTTGQSKEYTNDTPMGSLDNIFDINYASNSGVGNSDSTTTQSNSEKQDYSGEQSFTTTNQSTDNRNILRSGIEGNTPIFKIITEMHDQFLSIDMGIINDLEPLFMGVW